jgi:hypothetical protein
MSKKLISSSINKKLSSEMDQEKEDFEIEEQGDS